MDDFGTSELLVLSVAGPNTVLKALRAVLGIKKRTFKLYPTDTLSYGRDDPFTSGHLLMRSPWGYRSHTASLGLGTGHMVLFSRRPGLLPCMEGDAVWQEIRGVRHTTPLQRHWTEYIVAQLTLGHYLSETMAWGCKPGLLTAEDSHLDTIVQTGIRSGQIKIKRQSDAAAELAA